MITEFKIYEEITDGEPKVGCFVVGYISDDILSHVPELDFYNNHVGKIKGYSNDRFRLLVHFDGVLPNDLANPSTWSKSEIQFWSINKKECEEYIKLKKNVKKYNL